MRQEHNGWLQYPCGSGFQTLEVPGKPSNVTATHRNLKQLSLRVEVGSWNLVHDFQVHRQAVKLARYPGTWEANQQDLLVLVDPRNSQYTQRHQCRGPVVEYHGRVLAEVSAPNPAETPPRCAQAVPAKCCIRLQPVLNRSESRQAHVGVCIRVLGYVWLLTDLVHQET